MTVRPAPDYPVRLPGHGLVGEGIPAWLADGCTEEECPLKPGGSAPGSERASQFAGGHARCSCGTESEHLPSQGARRRWHKDHKRSVDAAGSSGEDKH